MNQAVLELLLQLKDEVSQGLDNVASKGGLLENAFSFATGGLIQKGVEQIGGAVVDAFGGMFSEAQEAQQGMAQLDSVLTSTGGKAGVTKDQVLALADSLSSAGGLSRASDDAVLAGENMLLTFTNIGSDVFPDVTQTMLDMATAMNNGAAPSAEQLKGQAVQLGKALNDPTKGIAALSKAGVSFTDEQKATIKSLQDMGDMAGAQKIVLEELAGEFGGSAASSAQTFGGQMDTLKGIFANVQQSLGEKLMPVLTGLMAWFTSPEVQSSIQAVADALGVALTGAVNFLIGAFNTFLPIAQNIFTFLSENIGPALVLLAGGISAVVIPAFVTWATTMLTVTLPALAATMAPVIAAAAPFIALAAVIAALWMAFDSNFLGIRDLVVPIVDQIVQAVSRFATEMMPLVISAWDAISSTITNAWTFVSGLVVSGIQALVEAWNSNWGGIQTIVSSAWGVISSIISVAWTTVTGIITTGLQLLSGDWGGAWTTIQTMLSDVWNTITNDLLPNALTLIGTLLTDFLPKLIGVLAEWTGAFFGWVWNDLLPQLPGWLWNIVSAVWTFVSENGPTILAKLGEWTTAFFNWVMNDVMPQVPGWLGNIAGGLWTWITSTAADLSSKLINEWIPSLWNWLTGPGGIIETLPYKMNDIWTGISNWIGQTATDIVNAAVGIGEGLYNGIIDGVAGLGQALWDFIKGVAQSVWDSITAFFTGGGDGGGQQQDPPHKATGGSLRAGQPVIAGDVFGPELFIPQSAGRLYSNTRSMAMLGAGMGGNETTITINIENINAGLGADGYRIADEFLERLENELGDQVAIRRGTRG